MVGFLYGTVVWVYFQAPSQNFQDQGMVASGTYTAITPLANSSVQPLQQGCQECTLPAAWMGEGGLLLSLLEGHIGEARREEGSFEHGWFWRGESEGCSGKLMEFWIWLLLISVLSQSCGHSTWAQGSLTSMLLGLLPRAFYLQLSNQSPGLGNLIPDF